MTLTDSQIAQRSSFIGASEIAAVLGLHPFQSALDLYADKLGLVREHRGNRFTRWGNKLEAVVAEAYSEETGLEVVADQESRVHPVHACVGATPDYRTVSGDRVVEIKTGDQFNAQLWGEPGTDQVPAHVACQVVQQMAVCDVDRADVAVLLGGNDFRVYTLTRDRAVEAALLEAAETFWREHVMAKVPPEPKNGEAAARFAVRLFPRNLTDELRQATDEEAEAILTLLALRKEQADLDNRVSLAEAALKQAIGESAGITSRYGAVTWRAAKSGGVDYKALAEKLGATADQIAAFARPGSRRFLVSPAKVVAS